MRIFYIRYKGVLKVVMKERVVVLKMKLNGRNEIWVKLIKELV